eukprot:COSAG02_NODE_5460_length_4301_cov_2.165397_2_plen_1343_part_01
MSEERSGLLGLPTGTVVEVGGSGLINPPGLARQQTEVNPLHGGGGELVPEPEPEPGCIEDAHGGFLPMDSCGGSKGTNMSEERSGLLGLPTGTVVEVGGSGLTNPPGLARQQTEVNPLHGGGGGGEPESEPEPEPESNSIKGAHGGVLPMDSCGGSATNPLVELGLATAVTAASSWSATYDAFARNFERGKPYPLQAAQQRLALAGLAHWRLSATSSVTAFDGHVLQLVGHLVRTNFSIGDTLWVRPHERAPFRNGIVVGFRPATGDIAVQGAPILLPVRMGASLLTPSTDVDVTNHITNATIAQDAQSFPPEHTLFHRAHWTSGYTMDQVLWVSTNGTEWKRGYVTGIGLGSNDSGDDSGAHTDGWRFDNFGNDELGLPTVRVTETCRKLVSGQTVWETCARPRRGSTYPFMSMQPPFQSAWTLRTATRNVGSGCWYLAQYANGQHQTLQRLWKRLASSIMLAFMLLESLLWMILSSDRLIDVTVHIHDGVILSSDRPIDVTVHIHDGVQCNIDSWWLDSSSPVALGDMQSGNDSWYPLSLSPGNHTIFYKSTSCGHTRDREDTDRGFWEVLAGHVNHTTASSVNYRAGGPIDSLSSASYSRPTTTESTWSVVSGQCTSSGACFRSPNYPRDYGNSQACSILAMGSGILSVDRFETESGFDFLRVGGRSYSGDGTPGYGPAGVAITHGEMIKFYADDSVQKSGFEICLDSGEKTATFSVSPDWRDGDSSSTAIFWNASLVGLCVLLHIRVTWHGDNYREDRTEDDDARTILILIFSVACICTSCFMIATTSVAPDRTSYWQSWWDAFSNDNWMFMDIAAKIAGAFIGLFWVGYFVTILQFPAVALIMVCLEGVVFLLWAGVLASVCSVVAILATAAWMTGIRTVGGLSVGTLRRVSVRLVWHCAQPIALLAWACHDFTNSTDRNDQVLTVYGWPALLIAVRGVACAVVTVVCLCRNPAFLVIDIAASARDAMCATGGQHVWALYLFTPDLPARLCIPNSGVEFCCSCFIDLGGACALAGILLQRDFTTAMPAGQAFLYAQTTLSTALSLWLTLWLEDDHPANLRTQCAAVATCLGGVGLAVARLVALAVSCIGFLYWWNGSVFLSWLFMTSWQLAWGFNFLVVPTVFCVGLALVRLVVLSLQEVCHVGCKPCDWFRALRQQWRSIVAMLAVLTVVCAAIFLSSDTADVVCSSEVAPYVDNQGLDAWQGDGHWWKRDGWVIEQWYKFNDSHVLPLAPIPGRINQTSQRRSPPPPPPPISSNSTSQRRWPPPAPPPSGCSGNMYPSPSSSFTGTYGNEATCLWYLSCPGSNVVALSFSSFETESGYDYVSVYDGNSTSSPRLSR